MLDVFDTYKRTQPVRFYKVQNETIVLDDPNVIADFYNDANYSGIVNSGIYQDFDARIIYLTKVQEQEFIPGGKETQVRGKQLYGKIKMIVQSGAFNYLKDTERFKFLNTQYKIDEAWRGVGILGDINYYSIVLSRVI